MSIVFAVCIFAFLTFFCFHNVKKIVEAVRARRSKSDKKGENEQN